MPTPSDLLKDLMLIQKRLNMLFEEPHSSFGGAVAGNKSGAWTPVVDCYETDDKYAITAELPGVARDDIDLHVHGRKVVLSGERKPGKEIPRDKFHRVECPAGKFHRTFEVSQEIDSTRIEAKLSDGVLRISLPKKSSSVRRIHVENKD